MNKGLISRLGETIDQYRSERQAQKHEEMRQGGEARYPRLLRWFLPNGGTLLLIAILIFTQNVWAGQSLRNLAAESAASTGTIAYQGRLADSSGNPLTSTLNMSFRLYNASTGGAPLWTEQWTGSNGVKVSDGLFNVMLGSLTPIPQAVITGNSTLFLGITVGTDDEMSPRVQLGSVPFAVQALSVPDGSITKAKLAGDVSLTPPDGSITTAKIADGAVTQIKAPDLLKNTYRQDGTTTTTNQTDQYMAKGWDCWGKTNGTTSIFSKNIGYSLPFTDIPIVVLTLAGNQFSATPPTSHGGLGSDLNYKPYVAAFNQTSSGFEAQWKSDPAVPAGYYMCFSWIAVGTLAN